MRGVRNDDHIYKGIRLRATLNEEARSRLLASCLALQVRLVSARR